MQPVALNNWLQSSSLQPAKLRRQHLIIDTSQKPKMTGLGSGDDGNGKLSKAERIEYSSRVLHWMSIRGSPIHLQIGTGSQLED